MTDGTDPRYDTRLNILCRPLEVIDTDKLAAESVHPWYNQTLCQVNDSVVRLGVLRGEYHWHHHDMDEFFHVIDGKLLIDLEGRTLELVRGQGVVIPRSIEHRPRAPQRTVVLMVENKGIIPTGT